MTNRTPWTLLSLLATNVAVSSTSPLAWAFKNAPASASSRWLMVPWPCREQMRTMNA